MDFETHLYHFGEMEKLLLEFGFKDIKVYKSFNKENDTNDDSDMFLFECRD